MELANQAHTQLFIHQHQGHTHPTYTRLNRGGNGWELQAIRDLSPLMEPASFLHLWLWGFAEDETRRAPRCKETRCHNQNWGKEVPHPGKSSHVPGTSYWPNAEPIPRAVGVKTLWAAWVTCRGRWNQPHPNHVGQALDWNPLREQKSRWAGGSGLWVSAPVPPQTISVPDPHRAQAGKMGGDFCLLPHSTPVHSDLCLGQRSIQEGQ